jgi:AcrR family transcriptional regulator
MKDTKLKIIEAAIDQFVEKGFSGTSISDIAKAASINQSLIYHHIGNKSDLWKKAKEILLGEDLDQNPDHKTYKNFSHFIQETIQNRIEIYEKDWRILRLIQWQNLEASSTDLIGINHAAPIYWTNIIKSFQEQKQIVDNVSADLIAIYIHSLINGLIFDHFKIFNNDPKKKHQFIELIENSALTVFQLK